MNQNRRNFLQQSSFATGALLLSPGFRHAKVRSSAKELRVGLVGCGGRGTGAAAQALAADPNNQLVAVADVFEDHAKNCLVKLEELSAIKDQIRVDPAHIFIGFDGYQKVVDACDVVLLATPPAFRPEHFEYAVSEEKHCFVEKPLSCDGPGTKRILAAGKASLSKNLKVLVGLQNRYDPAHIEMVKRIKKGMIGDVLTSDCYYMKGGYELIPRSAVNSELAFQIKNYHYFTWLWAGGPAGLQIHNADIVHWVKNGYPISAQGNGGRAMLHGPDSGDVFDHFSIEYTYADGTKMHSQVRNIDRTFRKNGVWFTGTKGTANVREGIKNRNGKTIWKFAEKEMSNAFQIEHDQFFDAIRMDQPLNNTEYGAKSTLTAIMGRMAAHSGQVLTWDEALNSEPHLKGDIRSWDEAPVTPHADGSYTFPRPGEVHRLG